MQRLQALIAEHFVKACLCMQSEPPSTYSAHPPAEIRPVTAETLCCCLPIISVRVMTGQGHKQRDALGCIVLPVALSVADYRC